MIRKQIYLTPQIDRELDILARQQGKSVAEIVRQILGKRLKIKDRQKKTASASASASVLDRITGIGKKSPGDLSIHLFDYLYGDKSPNYGKNKNTSR